MFAKLASRWLPPTESVAVTDPPAPAKKRRRSRAAALRRHYPGLPMIAARQLVASGHRTATSVAARSTAGLVADLNRWSLSSDGRRRAGYRLPTARQLDRWLGRRDLTQSRRDAESQSREEQPS